MSEKMENINKNNVGKIRILEFAINMPTLKILTRFKNTDTVCLNYELAKQMNLTYRYVIKY